MFEILYTLLLFGCLALFPGYIWAFLFKLPRIREPISAFALYLSIGMAFWPTLLLWTSTLGWRLTPGIAQKMVFTMGLIGIGVSVFRFRTNWKNLPTSWRHLLWPLIFATLFLLTLWTRASQMRSLVAPNWVDSIHHAMIVRIFIEQGQIPETFAPFMPTGQFLYHWGYHALVAWFAWLQGKTDAFDVIRQMLLLGQVFSILSVIMLYCAGRWLFGSRRVGIYVALFGGLISWFPAYYISWGRYTHLTGVLMMAPLGYSLWRLHKDKGFGLGWASTSALLASGLLLIHVRVAFFFGVWALLLALYLVLCREWYSVVKWIAAGVGALLVTAPWFLRLVESNQATHLTFLGAEAQAEWWNAINLVDWPLLWVPGVHEVMLMATGGISAFAGWGSSSKDLRLAGGIWSVFVLLAIGGFEWNRWKKSAKRLSNPPVGQLLQVVVWCAVIVLLLNLDRLGLPTLGFLTNNAAVITFFAPLSLFAGGLAAWVLGIIVPTRWVAGCTLFLLLTFGGWGGYQMRNIVNPATTLVRPADLRALHWIRENTPPDSLFAVNVKPWLGDTYAGTDAGAWISVLSDRSTILPPALYTSAMPYDEVLQMNRFFAEWSKINSLDNPTLRAQLRRMGVTHIYLGSRGGHLLLHNFFNKPYAKPVFSDDGVQIYELLE